MKILLYFMLIIAFIMAYEKNPVYSLVIIGIGMILFLFYRSRKRRNKRKISTSFLSGDKSQKTVQGDDVMKLLLYQQILNSLGCAHTDTNKFSNVNKQKRKNEINKIKQEVMDLFS